MTDELRERISPFWGLAFSIFFGSVLVISAAVAVFGDETGILTFTSSLGNVRLSLDALAGSLAATAIGGAVLRWIFKRRVPGVFRLGDKSLECPGRRSRAIPYECIDALQRARLLGSRLLAIGCGSSPPRFVSERRLVESEGLDRLREGILRRIRLLNDGERRCAEVEDGSRAAESSFGSVPWLTLALVTSLAVAFLMTDGGVEPLDDSLPFENVPRLVVSGEFFRLVTANWVHSDLLHLGFNAAALLIIGWTLEPLLGRPRMLLIGLTSGVLGALAFFPAAPEPYSSSVGSSAWAFGWIGCGLFLRVLRADSLPPILRVRVPWIGAGLFTALHLGFDDMPTWVQHAAGFAVGLVAALLLVSKQSIRTHSRRASALQAVAAGLVVAGAFAWSTASAALRGERNRTLLTRWIVEDESVDGAVLNDAAWAAAVDPGASPERLALAERLVRRALELDSDGPYAIDTLATVLYRREKLDEAVETAWTRPQRLQDPFALEQAARFELARQRRLGPQREGAGSEGDVELEWVTGAGEPPHLRLRAKDLFAEGLAVHAVAVRNGKPAAHARVWIGRRLGPGDVLDLAIPSEADSAFPGAQLVVTRIEVPPGVASGEVRSEVRALGSLTAGLP